MGLTEYIKRKLGIMEADGRIQRQPKPEKKRKKQRKLHFRVQPAIAVDFRAPSKPLTPDTRPRSDGKPSCPNCGHNKYATVKKSYIHSEHGNVRIIRCRFCKETYYVDVTGKIL